MTSPCMDKPVDAAKSEPIEPVIDAGQKAETRPGDATTAVTAVVAWFQKRVIEAHHAFEDDAMNRAAELPPDSPAFVAVAAFMRSRKVPIQQWRSAVEKRRAEAESVDDLADMASAPPAWRAALRTERGSVVASLMNLTIILRHTMGERLTFNEMTGGPHLDGKPLEDHHITAIRIEVESTEGVEFAKEVTTDAIVGVARQRSFHPVRAYLDGLAWDGKPRVGALAADYFGAVDRFSGILVARTMIACVARAFDPGCQVDTVLVAVGLESKKKSTFFRTLASPWFCDSTIDIHNKHGVMVMRQSWIYEWPEVERLMLRKAESEIKGFLTQRDDQYVPPYGRGVIKAPRSNVMVASTNEQRFLTAPNGSRRWWIVAAKERADIVKLKAERDQIWAEAVALYRGFLKLQAEGVDDDENEHRWWLTADEDEERKTRNDEFTIESADDQTVGLWLSGAPVPCRACKGSGRSTRTDAEGEPFQCDPCRGIGHTKRAPFAMREGREYTTIADVLAGALGIPTDRQDPRADQRGMRALKSAGWERGTRFWLNGRSGYKVTPYFAPEADPDDVARDVMAERTDGAKGVT